MKTIQINKNTFDVIVVPEHLHVTPRAWLFEKQVELIPVVQKGQRLKWIPEDVENPTGPGSLQVVDVPVRVPATLYPRQLWLALLQRDITEEDVAAKVATLTPEQQRIARIEMKGHVYERLSPWIGIIGAMLGLTESDMDDVFIVGGSL